MIINSLKIVFLFVFVGLLTACGSSSSSDTTDTTDGDGTGLASCQWHGNCSSTAPHGAYDCNGDSLMQCNDGTWDHVVYCGGTQNSSGYSCTCKGGCGLSTTECSYAFNVCEGHEYDTLP